MMSLRSFHGRGAWEVWEDEKYPAAPNAAAGAAPGGDAAAAAASAQRRL